MLPRVYDLIKIGATEKRPWYPSFRKFFLDKFNVGSVQ